MYDYSKNKLGSSALYTNSLCSKCRELLFIFIGQARRRSQEASLMGINEIVVWVDRELRIVLQLTIIDNNTYTPPHTYKHTHTHNNPFGGCIQLAAKKFFQHMFEINVGKVSLLIDFRY